MRKQQSEDGDMEEAEMRGDGEKSEAATAIPHNNERFVRFLDTSTGYQNMFLAVSRMPYGSPRDSCRRGRQ